MRNSHLIKGHVSLPQPHFAQTAIYYGVSLICLQGDESLQRWKESLGLAAGGGGQGSKQVDYSLLGRCPR